MLKFVTFCLILPVVFIVAEVPVCFPAPAAPGCSRWELTDLYIQPELRLGQTGQLGSPDNSAERFP